MRFKKLVASTMIGCFLLSSTVQGTEVFAASKTKIVQTKKGQKKQNNNRTKKVVVSQEELALKNRVKEAQINAANIKSAEATMKMVMDMNMEYQGQKQTLPMRTTGKITMFQNPMKAKMDLKLNTSTLPFMDNMSMQIYLEEKDDKITEYIQFGDEWQAIELSSKDMIKQVKQFNTVDNIDLLLKGLSNLKELGKEQVAGKETTKIEGILSKDAIKSLLESTGVLQMGNMMEEEQEITNKMLDSFGKIKITFWLTEDNQLVQVKEDLTEAMNKMMSSIAKEAGDDLKMGISKMVIVVTYNKINDVPDFTIPQEAYNAKKLEVPEMPEVSEVPEK